MTPDHEQVAEERGERWEIVVDNHSCEVWVRGPETLRWTPVVPESRALKAEQELEATKKYADEAWAWLDDALDALGAKTVFEIKDQNLSLPEVAKQRDRAEQEAERLRTVVDAAIEFAGSLISVEPNAESDARSKLSYVVQAYRLSHHPEEEEA